MKTKLFTLLFAFVASIGTICASNTQVDGIWYYFDNNARTATVTYRGDSFTEYEDYYTGSVQIPASVTYNGTTYSVTCIGHYAFNNCIGLTDITIPNSVTSIGVYAFSGCTELISIVIPDGVTSISQSLFNGCSKLASVAMGNSVTRIGDGAFQNCSSLESFTIAESVTSIDNFAFYMCSSLTTMTIPSSVDTIGLQAFANCSSLESVTIQDGVKSIGRNAFSKCENLTSVTLPNTITSIEEWTFNECGKLTSISIPNSVASLEMSSFYQCSSLTDVNIGQNITTIGEQAFGFCTNLHSIAIPNSVTRIRKNSFVHCSNLSSVVMGSGIDSIGASAFCGCNNLTTISCESAVPPTLGNDVFLNVKKFIPLYVPTQSVVLYQEADQWKDFTNILPIPGTEEEMIDPGHPLNPGNYRVTVTVDDEAAGSVSGSGMYPHGSVVTIEAIPNTCYEFVEWSDGVTENPRTFSLMEDVTLSPTWAMTILASGFCGNEDDNMTWELTCDSILSIRGTGVMMDFAYGDNTSEWKTYSDKIKHVVFSEGVTKIGDHAFMNCYNLASVRFPNTMTNIGWSSFNGCSSLISVIVPEGVTYISYATFSNCSSLTSITLPSSLTSIADFAFSGCTALATITIPRNVTDLYHSVFSSCTGLTSITCEAVTPPAMVNDAFYNVDRTIPLYVPALSMPVYKVTERWKEFLNIQTLETAPTYTHVKIGALYYNLYANSLTAEVTYDQHWYNSNYSGLQNISIPNAVVYSGKTYNVVRIGVEAFGPCTSLSTVTIPSSIKTIGKNAFYNCVALTNVNMSEGLVYMDDGVFSGCSKLASVTIPQSVAYMGTTMFHSCTKLLNVTLPNGLESVGYQMFYHCSGLSNMVLPDSVRQIGDYAFSGCSSMTAIYIPERVTSIGMGAFSNCSGLRAIELPEEIESIDYVAFKGCTGLTSFTCKAITPPSLTCPVFEDVNTTIPLNVPCAGIPQYRATFCWNNFTNIQAIDTIVITPYLSSVNPNNGSVNIVERSRIACDTLLLTIKADPSDGYDFLQWSDGNTDNPRSLILIHDSVITAEWVKTYIITWQNADSTILATDTVREGAVPAYTGETPTKAADAQYTYLFSGWSPDIVAAEADAIYTATYEATRIPAAEIGNVTIPNIACGDETFNLEFDLTYVNQDGELQVWLDDEAQKISVDYTKLSVEEQIVHINLTVPVDRSSAVHTLHYSFNKTGYSSGSVEVQFPSIPEITDFTVSVIDRGTCDNVLYDLSGTITYTGETTSKLCIEFGEHKLVHLPSGGSNIVAFTLTDLTDIVSGAQLRAYFTDRAECVAYSAAFNSPTLFFLLDTLEIATICGGDSLLWHGQWLKEAGTYYDTTRYTGSGCDSVRYALNLSVTNPAEYEETATICSGESYEWRGGQILTEAGEYEYRVEGVAPNGCDSIYRITIMQLVPEVRSSAISVCYGEPISINGKIYYDLPAGEQVLLDTIPSVSGCDSVYLLLDLNVAQSYYDSVMVISCDSFVWDVNGIVYTKSGIYHEALTTINGCDSICVLNLTISESYEFYENYTIPETELPYTVHDCTYSEAGTYDCRFTTVNGCDSIYHITIEVLPAGEDSLAVEGVVSAGDMEIGVNTTVTINAQGHLVVPFAVYLYKLLLDYSHGHHAQVTGIGNIHAQIVEALLNFPTPKGQLSKHWFAFAVPFEVSVATGIRIKGSDVAARYGYDFVIDEFDGMQRATTQQGWKRVGASAILRPGHMYMLATPKSTSWVLTAADPSELIEHSETNIGAHPSTIGENHAGWNGIANPMYANATANHNGIQWATTYNNVHGSYELQEMADYVFNAASPFFVQVAADAVFGFNDIPLFAPRRVQTDSETSEFSKLTLTDAAETYTDKAFISFVTDKEDSYLIGHDLQKMAANSQYVHQLWWVAYGMQLSAYEAPLGDEARSIPIGIYAPEAGDYTLQMSNVPANISIYLTENGQPVWDLAASGCTLNLQAGNNNGYALYVNRIKNVVTDYMTGNTEIMVQKVVMDDKIFIIRNGKTYNVTGIQVR